MPSSLLVIGCGLGGWDQADLAGQALVVEPVDVLADGDLEVVDGLPGSLIARSAGLEQRVERLGEGVATPMSSGLPGGVFTAQGGQDEDEGFAGDVALEDTQSVLPLSPCWRRLSGSCQGPSGAC